MRTTSSQVSDTPACPAPAPRRRRSGRPRRDAQPAGGDLLEAGPDLLARVLHGAAVEVGAGRRRGRGRVGHLVGAGRRQPHLGQRYAERGRGDLEHLGVQPLAHLGATVVDQHRAVLVDVHQRAGLVERGQVERDPELHRRDGQGPLGVLVLGVEPAISSRRASSSPDPMHLVPDRGEPLGVADRLAVGGGLRRAARRAVEVAPAQLDGVDPEQGRAPAEDVLDHDHALRPAEAAERGLRGLVGLRDPAVDPDVRHPVGVVDVAQGAGQHRLGQVQAPAAVGGQRRLERLDQAVVVEADPPLGVEAVALAAHGQVLGAVQPQPDRAAGQDAAERGDRGEAVRLHLLAAERRRPSAGTAP